MNQKITFKTLKTISDANLRTLLRTLYCSAHWSAYTESFSNMGVLLENSFQVHSAWDEDKLVGLIRTISDGYYVELIQDLLVLPEY